VKGGLGEFERFKRRSEAVRRRPLLVSTAQSSAACSSAVSVNLFACRHGHEKERLSFFFGELRKKSSVEMGSQYVLGKAGRSYCRQTLEPYRSQRTLGGTKSGLRNFGTSTWIR